MKALTTFFIMFVCMVTGLFLWLKVFGNKNAERFMKLRLQGPFVPEPRAEDVEDIATYRERVSEKSVDFEDVAASLQERGKL